MSTKTFFSAALTFIGTGLLAAAAAPTAGEVPDGTLMIQNKNYALPNVLAYEAKIDGGDRIVVVFTGRPVSSTKLKEVRKAEKEGESVRLEPPYVRLEYSKAGQFQSWSAAAGTAMIGPGVHSATGELTVQDGHVTGKAMQPNEGKESFTFSYDVHFNTPLLAAGDAAPAGAESKLPGPAANVRPTVTGSFKGNDKETKLSYVSARWREPFGDKPSIMLIFTEKDHSAAKKPDFDAGFGKFGSALVISLHEEGNIFGCEVAHPALKNKGFSAVGEIKTNDFAFENGQVTGQLTTEGPLKVFGETWEVDLKFVAPLGPTPAEFQPATARSSGKSARDDKHSAQAKANSATSNDDEASASAGDGNRIKAKELVVTKDASDLEYKALVGHIAYKSKTSVKAVCAELAKGLQGQGWIKEGSDMVNATSSILKRKRGDATLTIFVKPDGGGSAVNLMSEGLDWEGQ